MIFFNLLIKCIHIFIKLSGRGGGPTFATGPRCISPLSGPDDIHRNEFRNLHCNNFLYNMYRPFPGPFYRPGSSIWLWWAMTLPVRVYKFWDLPQPLLWNFPPVTCCPQCNCCSTDCGTRRCETGLSHVCRSTLPPACSHVLSPGPTVQRIQTTSGRSTGYLRQKLLGEFISAHVCPT